MSISPDDFRYVQRLVLEEAGLVLGEDKHYLVESRLERLAQLQVSADIAALLQQCRQEPALRQAIAEAMAIHETYFFRDPWLYEALRQEVLPALLQARAGERTLRIWCAACATGQEVYSICLLLREHFPQLAGWELDILASDFSAAALAQAESGRYSLMEANRGLPAALLARHFRRDGLHWQLLPELRQQVRFARINLVSAWPELPVFDIVLLRNVLIYFNDATRRDVLARVQGRLRPDGYLFMGGTESPLSLVNSFTAGSDGRAGYYRLQQRRSA